MYYQIRNATLILYLLVYTETKTIQNIFENKCKTVEEQAKNGSSYSKCAI